MLEQIRKLNLDVNKMINAHTNANNFIYWLQKYNHYKGYSNFGEALLGWCEHDGGFLKLEGDYEEFLRVVIAVLLMGKRSLAVRVGIDELSDDKAKKSEEATPKIVQLEIPVTMEGFSPSIPSRDEFFRAGRQAILSSHRHTTEFESGRRP